MYIVDAQLSSTRTLDKQGFLHCQIKVARTGEQQYLGRELQREPANQEFTLHRPEASVFAKDSLESFKDKDITLVANGSHPSKFIDPKTYKKSSIVGHIKSAGRREGDWVVVDAVLKDQAAIDAAMSGDVHVSVGYDSNIRDSNDRLEMHDIEVNHLSIVKNPRAGNGAKIKDNKGGSMPTKIKIGDSFMEFADESQASSAQKLFDDQAERLADAEQKAEKLEEEGKKKDADLEKAKKEREETDSKYKDAAAKLEKIEAKDAAAKASKLVKGFKANDSMTALDIKRQALIDSKTHGEFKDASAEVVDACFDMACAQAATAPANKSALKLGDSLSKSQMTDARAEYIAAQQKGSMSNG